jgi:hypothetical protein
MKFILKVAQTFLSDHFAGLWKLIDLLVRKDFRQANLGFSLREVRQKHLSEKFIGG